MRFQNRYRRTRRRGRPQSPRFVRLSLALGAFVLGICVIPLPVPELPFFVVSGALLATESLPMARALDRTEMRIHGACTAVRQRIGLPRGMEKLIAVGVFFASLTVTSYLFWF